jgi:hypothetical protein
VDLVQFCVILHLIRGSVISHCYSGKIQEDTGRYRKVNTQINRLKFLESWKKIRDRELSDLKASLTMSSSINQDSTMNHPYPNRRKGGNGTVNNNNNNYYHSTKSNRYNRDGVNSNSSTTHGNKFPLDNGNQGRNKRNNHSKPHSNYYNDVNTMPTFAPRNLENLSEVIVNTSSPFCFEISSQDLEVCDRMVEDRNLLYSSVTRDDDVSIILNQVAVNAEKYLYWQQENISQFYEDKKQHEISKWLAKTSEEEQKRYWERVGKS